MTPYRVRVVFRDVIGRLTICALLLASATSQERGTPEQEVQREAMKKFEFMVGKWSGDALWFVRQGTLGLIETKDVRFEKDGLVLRIEERAKNKLDGKPQLTMTAVISYDDQSGT